MGHLTFVEFTFHKFFRQYITKKACLNVFHLSEIFFKDRQEPLFCCHVNIETKVGYLWFLLTKRRRF